MAKAQTVERIPMGDFEENSEGELVVRQFEREIEEADIIDDAFSRIRALCGASTSPVKLALYRCVPNSRKENYICDLDTADFSPEVIKARFGGGEFCVKAYNERSKLTLNQRLCIEGDPVIVQPPAPGQKSENTLDVAALVAGMQEANRAMLAGLVQIMQPQQNSEVLVLEKMAMYKNLFSQPQQPQVNPMEMFIKGMEMAKELAPRPGGETTGMDVVLEAVKGFAPAIGDITQRLNAQQTHIGPPAPVVSLPHIGPPAQPAPMPNIQPSQDDEAMLKMYLAMLVSHARNGKDPVLYADLIADNMSDEQIMQLLNDPALMEKLIGMNAGVAENRAWFEQLLAELKNIMGLTEPETAPIVDANSSLVAGANANIGSAENTDIGGIVANK